MNRKNAALILLLLLAAIQAPCQTHIYERYAPHTDLEVAYIENLPLDSVNAINATIIVARDSAAWEWLKDEFHAQPKSEVIDTNLFLYSHKLCDKYSPESLEHGDILDCYLLYTDYKRHSFIIYQYENLNQYYTTIIFQHTHEKD